MAKQTGPTFGESVYLILGFAAGTVFTWALLLFCGKGAAPDPWGMVSAIATAAAAAVGAGALYNWRHQLDDQVAHEARVAVAFLCDGVRACIDELEERLEFESPGLTEPDELTAIRTRFLATQIVSDRLVQATAAARVRFGSDAVAPMREALKIDTRTFNNIGVLQSLHGKDYAGPKSYARCIALLKQFRQDADRIEGQLKETLQRRVGRAH